MAEEDRAVPANEDLWQHLKQYGVDSWEKHHAAAERFGLPHETAAPVMRSDIIKLLHALKKEADHG